MGGFQEVVTGRGVGSNIFLNKEGDTVLFLPFSSDMSQGPWGRLWDVCGSGQFGWVLAGEL